MTIAALNVVHLLTTKGQQKLSVGGHLDQHRATTMQAATRP
jgi:hypothetical protein